MNIRSKLFILNIVVNVSAMVLLGFLITFIVSNYIEESLSKELRIQNAFERGMLEKLIEYGKLDEEYRLKNAYIDEYNEKKDYLYQEKETLDLKVLTLIIDLKEKKILSAPHAIIERYNGEELLDIFNQDDGTFYNVTLFNNSFLTLNNQLQGKSLSGQVYDFLICSFVTRQQIVEIRNSILIILIILIGLITFLLIFLTFYYGKIIIKPINRLIQATKKIGQKQFDEKIHLKSGDEFEVLGNAINTMAQTLEDKDIEQKKFYETVSHDIKTPLTVISGYAQGMKTDLFKDKDKTLDKIIEECQELKKQLENVIFLSKLDTVKEAYKFEQLEMNGLIIESLNNVESLIILDEIDVDFTPVKDILFKGDRQKLLKAFVNILTNCIKYTSDLIIIKVEKKKSTVCVTIQDNGPGFSEEILQNAFSRDYIGEKDGTGIGLSIVKRVIEGHQGNLTLENDPSLGAIYRIQLPI